MGTKLKRTILSSFFFIVLNPARIAQIATDSYSEVFAAGFNPSPSTRLTSPELPPLSKSLVETSLYLDNSTKNALPIYFGMIRQNALAFGIDWRLILAIMKQESNFNRKAVSRRGAFGLMQIMPMTGMEVATKGFHDLHQPLGNITGGTFYLARLYKLFEAAPLEDRVRLALASYNAGPSRIYDAQEIAEYFGESPHSWESIERALPLLSKRFDTLHMSIWDGGKPRSGYFGESRQTILYVKKVMENYEHFKLALN